MGMPEHNATTNTPDKAKQDQEIAGDSLDSSLVDSLDSDRDIFWEFDATHNLEVIIADDRWAPHFDEALMGDVHQLVRFVSALIEGDGFTACLRWTDDNEMQALNAQFRDKDKATNVLSFPQDVASQDDEGLRLGDLAFGFETMAAEADDMGISVGAHMRHLIIHGLLHLIGCDHEDDDDASEMEGLEIAALSVIGISNPYQGGELLS